MIRYFLALASIACTAALVFGFFVGEKHGSDTIQAKWDTEKAAVIAAQREKETELQAGMDKLRTEKNNELARLNRHVRALSDSMRDRPERPTMPTSAPIGDGAPGCTGATPLSFRFRASYPVL